MQCRSPYLARDANHIIQPCPCGRCPWCLKRRASHWSFRLMQHEKMVNSSYFFTFTYDTDHVHITPNGYMGLRPKDLQDFWKKLRRCHERADCYDVENAIKYYAVGEYGGRKSRPHYHAIVFNCNLELMFPKEQLRVWHYLETPDLKGKYHMDCYQWEHGVVTVGLVSGASIGYTLKYAQKAKRIPMHCNDDRLRERSFMSQGLGLNYLTDAMKAWHLADLDNRVYCTTQDGKKIAMPRYYKNKLYNSEQRGYLKGHFEKLAAETYLETLKEYGGDEYKMFHDQMEATAKEFLNMYNNADKGRDNF